MAKPAVKQPDTSATTARQTPAIADLAWSLSPETHLYDNGHIGEKAMGDKKSRAGDERT